MFICTFAFAIAATGCERGCLRKKVDAARQVRQSGIAAPVAGVDCPDGLARCVGGIVEVSRLYSYDLPCTQSPEKCTCPWESGPSCSRGCAADGAVLPIAKERAEAQLCASPPNLPIFVPPPAVDALDPAAQTPSLCEGERYRCDHGSVIGCEPSAHRVAICTLGCAVPDATIDEPPLPAHDAADLLCLHPPLARVNDSSRGHVRASAPSQRKRRRIIERGNDPSRVAKATQTRHGVAIHLAPLSWSRRDVSREPRCVSPWNHWEITPRVG